MELSVVAPFTVTAEALTVMVLALIVSAAEVLMVIPLGSSLIELPLLSVSSPTLLLPSAWRYAVPAAVVRS